MKHFCIFLIKVYQVAISPYLGKSCRFEPSCSRYAIESYKQHGFFFGTYLAFKRILKCNPLGGVGFDPVPNKMRFRK